MNAGAAPIDGKLARDGTVHIVLRLDRAQSSSGTPMPIRTRKLIGAFALFALVVAGR